HRHRLSQSDDLSIGVISPDGRSFERRERKTRSRSTNQTTDTPRTTPKHEGPAMLTLGQRFPDFRLKGVVANDVACAFQDFDLSAAAGKWQVFFFYPKDFTFVCPTEIAGFAKLDGEFRERDAQVYAVSTDSEFVHLAWRKDHESLRELPFPMLSDLGRDLGER